MQNGYGICFNEWLFDKRIKSELNLLIYISSLTAETGKCFASNKHFSEKFGITISKISAKIKKLEALGFISVDYIKKNREIVSREIVIEGVLPKRARGIAKKGKDNITSNNNILFGAEEKTKEEILEILDEMIESYSSVISKNVRKTFSLEQNFFKFLRNWKFENESIFRDAWNTACQNYHDEIQSRNPNKDYAKHRFSLSEFLTQKNGFAKYLNK